MQTSNIDPAIDMLTKRFYQRLAEALNHRFPAVPVPVAPESATLDDFYDTVHKLMREHDTPALGIEHGYRTRISDYGVVGLAIASTGNLAEAMQVQADYLAIITDTKKFRYKITQQGSLIALLIEEAQPGLWPYQFVLEREMGMQIRCFSDLEPDLKLADCTLNLPYPCPTSPRHYRELLGCSVRFKQAAAVLTFPASWMEQPLKTADTILAPLLAERCQTILARMEPAANWVQRTRNHLLQSPAPMQSLLEASAALGVPVHTLRRRLYQEGTSYKDVVLEVRMQLARQYLEDTHLTLQQIGFQLGYSQPSNFQLAFKKYFAIAPGKWRSGQRT